MTSKPSLAYNPLGISDLPNGEPYASIPPGFHILDFLGIYLAQQFFTILMFAVISAFILPPMEIDLFLQWYGESGGIGTLLFAESVAARATKQTMLLAATLCGNAAAIGLYLFRGKLVYRLSWPTLGWRSPSWYEIGRWSLIFYPLVLAFTMSYNALLRLMQFSTPKQQVASFLSAEQPLMLRVFALLLVLLAAPLAEELLYRGVLFNGLKQHVNVQTAAILSGAIFGIAHIETMTMLPLAFLGYLLALAYHQSRSLVLPILLHACNNLLAFLFLWMFSK